MNHLSALSSDYDKFSKLLEKNKDKDIFTWLEYEKLVSKPGKQGVVGILRVKGDETCKCIFKISQHVDYLTVHESTIMNGLNSLMAYCPHFCKSYGLVKTTRNPKIGSLTTNPFEKSDDVKYAITEEVLLCEYIDTKYKMSTYIQSKKIPDDVIISTVKQLILSLAIAQKQQQFCHYDLHSYNIMMKKCNKDLVLLYILDDDNQLCVPTNGHYPVIIDYGFSYSNELEDGPLWPSMGHTDCGFTSDRFDWVRDVELLMVTLSSELKNYRSGSKTSKLFRRVTKNIFNKLSIDWESGWDENEDMDVCACIIDEISDISRKNHNSIFNNYINFCVDMIQTLIILPVETQDSTAIRKAYKAFLKEWNKIESQISIEYYNLYVLKCVVNAARLVRAEYMGADTQERAIQTFTTNIHKNISEISKYCNLKGVNYDTMLCSLYVLSNGFEGIMFDKLQCISKRKKKCYSQLPLKSTEQIYAAIESNIPCKYVYNKKSTIMVIDSTKKKSELLQLTDDQIVELNKIHNFCKGTFLNDIYINNPLPPPPE